jgi:hypothetical protein
MLCNSCYNGGAARDDCHLHHHPPGPHRPHNPLHDYFPSRSHRYSIFVLVVSFIINIFSLHFILAWWCSQD